MVCATIWNGIPLAICPYLDHYFLASSGNTVSWINLVCLPLRIRKLHLVTVFSFNYFLVIQFYVCALEYDTTLIGRVKVIKYATERTRFIIKSLTAHCSRIAVGDGRDGIIFFSYDEVSVDVPLVFLFIELKI